MIPFTTTTLLHVTQSPYSVPSATRSLGFPDRTSSLGTSSFTPREDQVLEASRNLRADAFRQIARIAADDYRPWMKPVLEEYHTKGVSVFRISDDPSNPEFIIVRYNESFGLHQRYLVEHRVISVRHDKVGEWFKVKAVLNGLTYWNQYGPDGMTPSAYVAFAVEQHQEFLAHRNFDVLEPVTYNRIHIGARP